MMIRRLLPKSVEQAIHWYERYISPLSLLAGFLMDNFVLLRRVDVFLTNALFVTYLVVAALGILVFHLIETGRWRKRWVLTIAPFVPVVVQFSFGGLFSGFLSLYSRSAAFAASWTFVVLLVLFLILNERFARYYRLFSVQIGVYFFTLFSFFAFFLPVVQHRIGPMMFLTSGVVSLAVICVFLYCLYLAIPEILESSWKLVFGTIAAVFFVFNLFYFTNVIPPLPLALKQGGVYHNVTKKGDEYVVQGESVPWFEDFLNYAIVYHAAPGESMYAWSAIFAPSGLSVGVFHRWQWYDPSMRQWKTIALINFPINGGRDGGYRGYSTISSTRPGAWRVDVVTQYGELIGRIDFTVVSASTTAPLVSSTL